METTYELGVCAVADCRPEAAPAWFAACKAAGDRGRGEVEYRWAREILARTAGDPAFLQRYREKGAEYLMSRGLSND